MTLEHEKTNNKELVPLAHYLEQYRTASPAELAERTGIPYDAGRHVFRLSFYGREYEVGFPDFDVACLDDRYGCAPLLEQNAAKILAVRYLLEGAAVQGTGKFLTYRDVPWGEVYYRQFNGRCMQRLAFGYGNRLDTFCRAMEAMGAQRVQAGDAGYQAEVFPGYYVQLLLWAGDDEFPPSSQILFSDNFPAAFHPEDLVVVCDVLLNTMKKL